MSDHDMSPGTEFTPGDPGVPDVVAWLQAHPSEWEYATVDDALDADPAARRALNEIYRHHDTHRARALSRRRRLRWGVALGGVAVALGGVAVAAVFSFGQPTRPESGTLCRARAELDGDAAALAAGEDPIAGCTQVWESGQFGPVDAVPPLTACIGPHGVIEVFPDEPGVCERLDLAPADPALSDENELIVQMQDRLTAEINLAECQAVSEAAEQARRIITETGISGWHVVIEPGSETGVCGKTAVDTPTRTVTIHEF